MKIGILGSGFGLYGWLVAIIKYSTNEVLTLKKYKKIIENRKDIKKYKEKIQYCNNENELLNNSHKIVIAKTPLEQERIIKKIIKLRLKKKLYLEKPLASNPIKSMIFLKLLKKNKISFIMSLPFQKTQWFSILQKKIFQKNFKCAKIIWNFKSKFNNTKNWKNKKSQGGGILRFYFIHFFYLLTALNKNIKMENFIINKDKIQASFSINKKLIFLNIDKNKKNEFKIRINNKYDLKKTDNPFNKKQIKDKEDIRVKYLRLIMNIKREKYQNILNGTLLWAYVENKIKY